MKMLMITASGTAVIVEYGSQAADAFFISSTICSAVLVAFGKTWGGHAPIMVAT